MINFLYCFDDNYNFRAFSSMISLLDKINSKVNIFIIHKSRIQTILPNKIINHKYLNNLVFINLKKKLIITLIYIMHMYRKRLITGCSVTNTLLFRVSFLY